LFGLLGLGTTSIIGILISAVVGAIIVLLIYRAIAKK
jgi:uncharacterized membrane protein YeaQ/YmgE (transglycosylase-associated protein family)